MRSIFVLAAQVLTAIVLGTKALHLQDQEVPWLSALPEKGVAVLFRGGGWRAICPLVGPTSRLRFSLTSCVTLTAVTSHFPFSPEADQIAVVRTIPFCAQLLVNEA